MRLSCNGCRVLRRGCNPDCPIRPCLRWIDSPTSQANATLFLAKFYGRAGLLNLLTNAPTQLQTDVFKSLLYEACGRIVNPVFGSIGLLSTKSWHLCEAAVKAVLNGEPIEQAPSTQSTFQACDIRHVAKSGKPSGSDRLHRSKSKPTLFKRRAGKLKPNVESTVAQLVMGCSGSKLEESVTRGTMSHDSGSGVSEHRSIGVEADSSSIESVELARAYDEELELDLTLGWGPTKKT